MTAALTSVEQQVLAYLEENAQDTVRLLQELVRFPSVTGSEGLIQGYISERLRSLGLQVEQWETDVDLIKDHPGFLPVKLSYEGRPNVIGTYRGTGGGRSLLFNGHVDVIPAKPELWEVDPWAAEVRDGKLYGRGASDMKSGLAAMTMAMEAIVRCGVRLKGNVILEYVVDEEFSGNSTLCACLKGYKADAGISTEAGDLEIQPAVTGSMWFEIDIEGRSASMSRRWEAVSAIEKAFRIYQAVEDLERIRISDIKHPLYPDTRGSLALFIGMMEAGTFPSAPPAKAILRGRMGVLPNEDPYQAQQQLKDYIQRVAETDPWLRHHPPKVTFTGYFAEPAEIDPDHPICTTLASAFRSVTGKEPVVRGHDGAADNRFLIKYGNTPTPIFGPGIISQMHADNEWVPLDNLHVATKVLALATLRWCGYEGD
jgi:acetylornithine deacetylase